MRSAKRVTETIILELNEQEAQWLRGYMQNSLLADETPEDYEMRGKFFDAVDYQPNTPPQPRSETGDGLEDGRY